MSEDPERGNGVTPREARRTARNDPVASADDLIVRKLSKRFARDMATAIDALEGCRPHLKTPQALAALNRTVDRLLESSRVHCLLACPGSGQVSLDESVYALAVSMRKAEPGRRPVQLTFELDPVKASGSISRVLLHFLADVITGLIGGAGISDDTIGVRLSLSDAVLELAVSHATAGGRAPSFELASDTVMLAGAIGAQITRRHSPAAAEWRIATHLRGE